MEFTRRDHLKQLTTAGLGLGLSAVLPSKKILTEQSLHRLHLKAGPLEALLVDNHDGLSGERQRERRNAIPSAAGGLGRLFSSVPFEERFNGYNGLASLRYSGSASPFLPCAAGLNCEFFFDNTESNFEPRWSDTQNYQAQPSFLKPLSASSAELTIRAGKRWKVRVETRFELVEPFFVDVEHSFTPTDPDAFREFMGVFWASYIQVPKAPAFYFLYRSDNNDLDWMNVADAVGPGESGVIAPIGPTIESQQSQRSSKLIYGSPGVRYAKPLLCGRVHDMLLGLMFQTSSPLELRFAFNPQGGGPGVPAWDYQTRVSQPRAGSRYSFKVRVVYKPFESVDEMVKLYETWINPN